MWRYGVKSALTSDKHFMQAGFQILMNAEQCGVAEPIPTYGEQPSSDWLTHPIRVAA